MAGAFFFPFPATRAPSEPEEPEEPEEPGQPEDPELPEEPSRPVLEEGDEDPEGATDGPVREFQRKLNAHGAFPPLVIDGIFGPKTTAALVTFQGSRGLEVTAKTDAATWAELDKDPPPRAPGGPRPNDRLVVEWVERFEGIESSFWSTHRSKSLSGDSYQFYGLRYGIDAYTALYEATGATRFLDRALELVENVIDDAVSVAGGYRGWKSKTRSGYVGKEVPLDESHGLAPAFRLIRVMPSTGSYGARRDAIRAFLQRNMWEKWTTRSMSSNVLRGVTHIESHFGVMSLNLHAVTGVQAHGQLGLQILTRFGGQLRAHPVSGGTSSVWWDATIGRANRPGQDLSHANAVVSMVVDAVDLGVPGWAPVIPRLCKLLDWLLPKGDPEYIDGTSREAGLIVPEWCRLGGFEPGLFDKLAARPHSDSARARGQAYANLARSAARLAS